MTIRKGMLEGLKQKGNEYVNRLDKKIRESFNLIGLLVPIIKNAKFVKPMKILKHA